jgi:hypothetical protein
MKIQHWLTLYITLDVSPPVLERVDRLLDDLEKWLQPTPDPVVGIVSKPDSPSPK